MTRKVLQCLLTLALVLGVYRSAEAQVAFDGCAASHSAGAFSSSEASYTFDLTPSGTLRGVLVFTFVIEDNVDYTTSVTADGSALTQVGGGTATDTVNELQRVETWFLGSSVPSGTLTIVTTRTNNAQAMNTIACGVTAGGDTEVYEAGIVLVQEDNDLVEQSVSDGSPGTNSVRFLGLASGVGTVASAGANSTTAISNDIGAEFVAVYRETTAGQGSRSIGATYPGGPDDTAAVHLAVRQTGGGGGSPTPRFLLLGVGSL